MSSLLKLIPALLLLVHGAAAQRQARNDPALCPYCKNDPEVMERAGVLSHGPFDFAGTGQDTRSVDEYLVAEIYWIETEHFEIGLGLPSYRVAQSEKKKIRAELTELAEVLPEVEPKTKLLDEWLRVHLFAQRTEQLYARFLELVNKDQAFFPAGGETWVLGTPYRGEGPHLGQEGKFEVIVLSSEAEHVAYLKEQYGLSVTRTQRWNEIEMKTLSATIHLQQGSLKVDEALHGHLAFNLAINMMQGYKHYSYDTPLWILEGVGHLLEREITTKYNTFDGTEGALAAKTRKTSWMPEVRKLIQGKQAPRMAELIHLKSFAAFDLDVHFTTWSMIDFLIREHPEAFACIVDRIHGRKNKEGYPDSAGLRDVHREAFGECLGLSYAAFDRAWQAWVATQGQRKD